MSDWDGIDLDDPAVKAWLKSGGGRIGGVGYGGGGGGIGPLGNSPSSPLSTGGSSTMMDPRRRREDFLYGGTPDFSGAADRVNASIGAFNPNMNPNDPELLAGLGRLRSSQRERGIRSRDEFARAGLLGSSAMVGGQEGLNTQFAGETQDFTGSMFGKQRGEQLSQYNSDLDFRRNMEGSRLNYLGDMNKMRVQAEIEKRMREQQMLSELLGGIGNFAGDMGYGYLANRFKWL